MACLYGGPKCWRRLVAARETVIVLPADVSDPDAVEEAFQQFVSWAGRLDVLFNNAGLFTRAAPIDEVSLEADVQLMTVMATRTVCRSGLS
ncbi:short chain dehydrogenase [Aliiroseovarius crassostreae]|uniref:Uncharacterized protein n=1 Tax=Aliiroseovarius crassostreae TaxID=154981 RepID=A0A0P7J615_9RHOB|nr:SDR family NAD(P)-dependent oxidoreductase [Aliiroseovarius crassostreae]KPN63576.1 hypothetical protein AKJ29_13150 [Aliiroseovarius crassostreae]SFU84876.1 short chain dehydrogenase [Aliiroseovarius crassostreae]